MGANSSIICDVYDFSSVNNKFVKKTQTAIPLPATFDPATSPDPNVFVYSKVVYQMPTGLVKEAYTAETVSQLLVKANA